MRQCRDGLGLALETQQRFGILGELFGENFDGDIAIEAKVACPVDFTHTSGANRGKNFIRAETSAGREIHCFANLARIRYFTSTLRFIWRDPNAVIEAHVALQ